MPPGIRTTSFNVITEQVSKVFAVSMMRLRVQKHYRILVHLRTILQLYVMLYLLHRNQGESLRGEKLN